MLFIFMNFLIAIVIIFLSLQKYIVGGLTAGSVKG
jgi:ABC-type maltose transport system permease subunit